MALSRVRALIFAGEMWSLGLGEILPRMRACEHLMLVTSLYLKKEASCVWQGCQPHLLIRKLPCTLATIESTTMSLHPPCEEMSHSEQSHLDGPDGALTSSDLGWVFRGAGAQGLPASQSWSSGPASCSESTNLSPPKGLADWSQLKVLWGQVALAWEDKGQDPQSEPVGVFSNEIPCPTLHITCSVALDTRCFPG